MLERLGTKLFIAFAGISLLGASFLFGYGVGSNRVGSGSDAEGFSFLKEVEEHINDSAISKVSHQQLFEGAIKGMVRALDDPYSEYLDPKTYQSLQDSLASHYSGVGVTLKQDGDQFRVVSVLSDTPASKSGIAPGDVIVAVDGKRVAGMTVDEVARLIQGEPGSRVSLTIMRDQQSLDLNLVREKIERDAVEGRIVTNRMGHIRITLFNEGVGEKVREFVHSLTDKGARGFILDLRGNPGGNFDEGVEVASAFLEGGKIVSFRERGRREVNFEAQEPVETKLPLVVMVDEGSASASEIVAGAIQDRGRGIVVGSQTFGKNAVQTVIPLSDGSALKLTTASFYTPSGRSIGDHGITPDVTVAEKDLQLARAQQILREILAQYPETPAA
jgi:carboxyl-terminal processing protease